MGHNIGTGSKTDHDNVNIGLEQFQIGSGWCSKHTIVENASLVLFIYKVSGVSLGVSKGFQLNFRSYLK